ncbi:hypothetical protein HYPSUDRAFT_200565 [Hypholoma sublateritium FD-334 SS-4]|uniref:Uncharacterized protein n=1 Tax=Hypholoma sublateritium (strain FD-334 SS-4) TaxID=945553 RepID=A0A0D2LAS6_HYPSF|nr:hypothetical protein HYPSUDRAFT_200565 [Hypholoma sublateritium FD-334 SS-4]
MHRLLSTPFRPHANASPPPLLSPDRIDDILAPPSSLSPSPALYLFTRECASPSACRDKPTARPVHRGWLSSPPPVDIWGVHVVDDGGCDGTGEESTSAGA